MIRKRPYHRLVIAPKGSQNGFPLTFARRLCWYPILGKLVTRAKPLPITVYPLDASKEMLTKH